MSERTQLPQQRTAESGCLPAGYLHPWTPQGERDAKRERLAEELLKILTEETVSADPDLKGRMVEAADAALAAAEKVYPELPEVSAEMP